MRRPTDQAKLLFLYLLRSSAAALATTTSRTTSVGKHVPSLLEQGHIQLRLARRADVPSIQKCNLASLPENYNSQFYINHLRQWPELALVAEHVVPPPSSGTTAFGIRSAAASTPPNIVAYVLGKVDVSQPPPHVNRVMAYPPDIAPQDIFQQQQHQRPEQVGHVTSLAVLEQYRRRGLAAALMNQLHVHLSGSFGVNAVGLHVRVSNVAATQLYQRDGYVVDCIIPNYYQDGEDAYFMKKALPQFVEQQPNSRGVGGGRWLSRRPRPWETGPARLPRIIVDTNDEETVMEEEEEPQIMTGTF